MTDGKKNEPATMRFKARTPSHPISPPPPASGAPSVLAFSLAKAGSTLLYNMLSQLCGEAGLTYFSPEDTLFQGNVSVNRRPARVGDPFSPTGYCYGGFRQYPSYKVPILASARSIFLVRDPRDMAVSLYFSMLKSHVIPEGEDNEGARGDMMRARGRIASQGIDAWVTRAALNQYTRMFEGYLAQGFLWRKSIATYRYEDVIFDKRGWLADICDWYGWNVPAATRDAIADRFDHRPDTERPGEHVRQVTPGNYRAHLSTAAINHLNQAFGEYMHLYGYSA